MFRLLSVPTIALILPLCLIVWYIERKGRKAEPLPTYAYAYAFINSRFLGTKEEASLSANIPGYNIVPTAACQWWTKTPLLSQGNLTVHGWYI